MEAQWWVPHLSAWLWVLPLSFIVVCLFFLFAYLVRGPRWFYGRKGRHELSEAAREILDRRYASGEISREQYEEMRRVLAS